MIIKNEWGKTLVLDAGFDLSAQTGLSLTIDRPDGTSFTRTQADGLQVGPGDLVVDGVTYSANTYVTYVLQDGDLPIEGRYYHKLTVSFTSKQLSAERTHFTVYV